MGINKITIPFSEGIDLMWLPLEFDSYEDINNYLFAMKPPELGCYKTDFEIYINGEVAYQGRFDVDRHTSNTLSRHLQKHIYDFWNYSYKNGKTTKEEFNKIIETLELGYPLVA